jgi:hypothetical protein
MKDKGIDKGLVQNFETSDKLNKGNKYGFRKMFWEYLKKLNVPFSEQCCEAANVTDEDSNKILPVAYVDGSLKFYNPETKAWEDVA